MTVSKDVMPSEDTELPPQDGVVSEALPAGEALTSGLPAEPLDSALARVSGERDELKDRYLRLAAEYDNFRKRSQRERAEAGERGQAELLGKLLEVLDDLDRVVDGGDKIPSVSELHQAVLLTDKKLWKELEKFGLEIVDPAGAPFDPSVHEAIAQVPAPVAEGAGTIAAVFQVGYRFKGILLRPARVQVYGEPG